MKTQTSEKAMSKFKGVIHYVGLAQHIVDIANSYNKK